jgi:predicted nucleic acid-binding protein
MSKAVLLDNTVLTNFALIARPDLVLNLWPGACTTPEVQAEYQAGVQLHQLQPDVWHTLTIVTLIPAETEFAGSLGHRLGAGERSCIAVAHSRNGLFASDDLDARRQAQAYGVSVTGTIGILLLNLKQKQITLDMGNDLLTQLIQFGYRSPVTSLENLA